MSPCPLLASGCYTIWNVFPPNEVSKSPLLPDYLIKAVPKMSPLLNALLYSWIFVTYNRSWSKVLH